jgi:hypothetical protein
MIRLSLTIPLILYMDGILVRLKVRKRQVWHSSGRKSENHRDGKLLVSFTNFSKESFFHFSYLCEYLVTFFIAAAMHIFEGKV